MSKFGEYILPNSAWLVTLIYVWHKFANKKIDFKDKKLYITFFGLMFISILNFILVDKFVRIVLVTIIFMFFYKYLFKVNIKKSIATPIYYQFLMIISELICGVVLTGVFRLSSDFLLNNITGIFITNAFMGILSMILINFKFMIRLYNKVLEFTEKIGPIQLLFFCLIIMIFLNIFDILTYYKISIHYLIIINTSVILVCFIIVLYSLKTQNNYKIVSDKYNIAINSLNDYENMISKYRINKHENKNLLLTIRAMAKDDSKEIPEYIDSILDDKFDDDEKLFQKINKIPAGGLRATIYSEILKMKLHKIKYDLIIEKNVRTVDLIELDTDTILSACKIIGVFFDNAIEAVLELKKKEILICMYNENDELNIKISNNFINNFDISKIYDEGYTTKGENHGYGLVLVKKIIDENSLFKNELSINKNIFTQILTIKYKK